MNTNKGYYLVMLVLLLLTLSGCAPAAQMDVKEVVVTVAVPMKVEVVVTEPVAALEKPPAAPQATPYVSEVGVSYQPATGPGGTRMIIKNAEVTMTVEDTDNAIDRLTQVVADVGGYIISQRVWYEPHGDQNYKYATITVGVPVDEFERSLRRLREIAVRVLDENATGEDVSSEYVDLESRLRNLEATRDRIRQFLDQAKTVEEALKVNQQLSDVEEEIETIQGRMNYLSNRAAFSTITVNLQPVLPELTATPTLTPKPTATTTPTPTPVPWNPSQTFEDATRTFENIWKSWADFGIYFIVVGIPCLIPLVLIGWGIWWLAKRRKSIKPEAAKEQSEEAGQPKTE